MSDHPVLDQQHYFVSCPRGLEDLLQNELQDLAVANVTPSHSGVMFDSTLEDAYKVCLWSRIASRVLLQLSTFAVEDDAELYKQVQLIDWSQHMDVTSTLAVNCFINDSNITNSQYAALKVKDAIVDQFTEKLNERPSVDKDYPDIRINLHINKNHATLSLDLSGDALHKRGYRLTSVTAPLKENLAAAILMRSGWPNENLTLVDLMCGSGTFLLEAAYMALHMAPGLKRDYYGFTHWKGHDRTLWNNVFKQAKAVQAEYAHTECHITGYDISPSSISAARQNIHAAGLQHVIQIEQRSIEDCQQPEDTAPGLVVVNPPYGERLGDVRELAYLYSEMGECWRNHFPEWNVAMFTGNEELAKDIGLRAHKTNSLYNGAIKCKLFHYKIRQALAEEKRAAIAEKDEQSRAMFANRLKKNFRHLAKWAKRNNIECYRVYDADLPEYAAAIDIYAGWVHVQEYQAPSSIDIRKARQRMDQIIDITPEVLGVAPENMVVKTRRQQKGLAQYEKQASEQHRQVVSENGLKFIVNLQDYLDTGLFLDHRTMRENIRQWAKGKHFLNLFAYTGSVSVYAAAGGAISTTTVDMSNTYISWARKNFELNGLTQDCHTFVKADCIEWLKDQKSFRHRYDLIFLDPPTFSNSKTMTSEFDVQRDHVFLIRSAMSLLNKDGVLVFSNNFRRFKMDDKIRKEFELEDISQQTIPEDFKRNQKIHNCWLIKAGH